MNPAIESMLSRYPCVSSRDYENALKEIIQEVALLGLWRSKFFEHAAFYGGTALRILYGMDRFSEDLDFSLLQPNREFSLKPYLKAIEVELTAMGFDVRVERKKKSIETAVESAFIKAGTQENLFRVQVPASITQRAHRQAQLNIKLEVDTDPPAGFETEARTLLQPIPFSVNTYQKPDLFAGKVHAILQRNWKGRVKGRDYYDFVWYVARGVPVRLGHLQQRLVQSGAWSPSRKLTQEDLQSLLSKKLSTVDIKAAKDDVLPFLRDSAEVRLWSHEFFTSLVSQLKVV
jgi:predicted nucleotidyltransferase component of viral defense system